MGEVIHMGRWIRDRSRRARREGDPRAFELEVKSTRWWDHNRVPLNREPAQVLYFGRVIK